MNKYICILFLLISTTSYAQVSTKTYTDATISFNYTGNYKLLEKGTPTDSTGKKLTFQTVNGNTIILWYSTVAKEKNTLVYFHDYDKFKQIGGFDNFFTKDISRLLKGDKEAFGKVVLYKKEGKKSFAYSLTYSNLPLQVSIYYFEETQGIVADQELYEMVLNTLVIKEKK